ncbi:hypothetical protein U1Q18_052337 [Sarracenia purpurea var. burkii]
MERTSYAHHDAAYSPMPSSAMSAGLAGAGAEQREQRPKRPLQHNDRTSNPMHNMPPESRPLSYDPTVVAAPYTTLSMVGYPTPVSAPMPQQQQLYPAPAHAPAHTPMLTSTPAARYAQADVAENVPPSYSSGPAVAVAPEKSPAMGQARAPPTYEGAADAVAAAAARDREREARARAYPPRAGSATGQHRSSSRSGSIDASDAARAPRQRTESNASAQSSSSEHSFTIARKPVPRISQLSDPATGAQNGDAPATRCSSTRGPLPQVPTVWTPFARYRHGHAEPAHQPRSSQSRRASSQLWYRVRNAVNAALADHAPGSGSASAATSSAVATTVAEDAGHRRTSSGRRRTLPPLSPNEEDAYGGLA